MTTTPTNPPPSQLAVFVATFGGAGYLPKAPGTWAAALALPFAFLITFFVGSVALFIIALAAFGAGIWAVEKYLQTASSEDPAEIVIDEVAALWLLLAFAPSNPLGWVVGFAVFRFLDIQRIWPAKEVTARFSGAWAVMLDDMIAAGYLVLVFIITTLLAAIMS